MRSTRNMARESTEQRQAAQAHSLIYGSWVAWPNSLSESAEGATEPQRPSGLCPRTITPSHTVVMGDPRAREWQMPDLALPVAPKTTRSYLASPMLACAAVSALGGKSESERVRGAE